MCRKKDRPGGDTDGDTYEPSPTRWAFAPLYGPRWMLPNTPLSGSPRGSTESLASAYDWVTKAAPFVPKPLALPPGSRMTSTLKGIVYTTVSATKRSGNRTTTAITQLTPKRIDI